MYNDIKMNKITRILGMGMLFSLPFLGWAQQLPVLTLDEAVQTALKENYGIRIAQQNTEIAAYQIFKGNAGYSPTITYNANFGTVLNYVDQSFFDGRSINRFGRQLNPNTNVALTWVAYDGQLRKYLMDQFRGQEQQMQSQKQVVIQNTIAQLMILYFDIMRQKQSVGFLEQIVKYYEERLQITEQRWQIGRASKLDYLQSRTDLTAQLTELTNARNNLANAKVRMNTLLNRDPMTTFEIQEIPNFKNSYDLKQLIQEAKTGNPQLALTQKLIELQMIAEKQANSFKLPRVFFNSSLSYASSNNSAGLIELNINYGLNAGLGLTWNIFDGHRVRRNIETAKLRIEVAKEERNNLLNQIIGDLHAAYNQFQADQQLLGIEEENKSLAEENLTISLEKYRLGSSTILEINEAQRRFDTSVNRLVNARYNVKVSELELLRLSGNLPN